MTNIIIVNAIETPQIAAGCRALQYGDAVFTTIAILDAKPALWPLHLARLQHAVQRLQFPEPDWQLLEQTVWQQAAQYQKPAVLKVLLSRGIGGRGYAASAELLPQVYIYHAAMPNYQDAQLHGLQLGIATLQLAIQPALAGLKHTNRLEQVLLKQELAATHYDDLLVLDQQQQVTEAIAANVFYQVAGKWFTPPLLQAGVAGVMRQHVINTLSITERTLPLAQLAEVEAMFLTSALLQIAPVRQLAQRMLPIAPVQLLQQEMLC